jgi:hypothetical protein
MYCVNIEELKISTTSHSGFIGTEEADPIKDKRKIKRRHQILAIQREVVISIGLSSPLYSLDTAVASTYYDGLHLEEEI